MKANTDLFQSKKLAEFLPIESADMYYHYNTSVVKNYHEDIPNIIQLNNHFTFFNNDIPCWSLAALLDVLPQSVRLVGTPKDSYWYCECVDSNNQRYAGFGSADNPIDACYEMIILLHTKHLL